MEELAKSAVANSYSEQILKTLRQTRIFSRLSDPQLHKVALVCSEEMLPTGYVIYRPGEPAEKLYVLVSGSIEISYGTRASSMQLSVRYGQHEIFGWASLLPRKSQRIATATTLAQSVLFIISGANLTTIMEQDFDMGYSILREFNGQISSEIKSLAVG